MLKLEFPRFSRKFTASLIASSISSILWAGLTALFAVNVFARTYRAPSYWSKLEAALQEPFSTTRHRLLAQELWQEGLRNTAKKEAILGASTEDLLNQWKNASETLAQAYQFWQSVALAHPDYRDAYITLASLAYQLGKTEETKRLLNQAIALDSNNKVAKKFEELIKK